MLSLVMMFIFGFEAIWNHDIKILAILAINAEYQENLKFEKS